MDTKRALRARLRAGRAKRPPAEIAASGAALARHALDLYSGSRVVAAYASVGTEPPTRPLLDALTEAGVELVLPVVTTGGLDWARYDGWAALVDARGLLEPAGPRLGHEAIRGIDVVLMPALAVDVAGHRLGQGGGYYDRAVAGMPTDHLVAVVYDDEVLTDVPADPHDVAVGAALTPAGRRVFTG